MSNSPHHLIFEESNNDLLLILDRDNTLTIDTGYQHQFSDDILIHSSIRFLQELPSHKVQIHIATNQGGVALGRFSEGDSRNFSIALHQSLASKGVRICSVVSCFHHPKSVNLKSQVCGCRKPNPGMLSHLLKYTMVSPENALMIGDSKTDMDAARNAGIDGILLNSYAWTKAAEWVANRC